MGNFFFFCYEKIKIQVCSGGETWFLWSKQPCSLCPTLPIGRDLTRPRFHSSKEKAVTDVRHRDRKPKAPSESMSLALSSTSYNNQYAHLMTQIISLAVSERPWSRFTTLTTRVMCHFKTSSLKPTRLPGIINYGRYTLSRAPECFIFILEAKMFGEIFKTGKLKWLTIMTKIFHSQWWQWNFDI